MSKQALSTFKERLDSAEEVDAALISEAADLLRDVLPGTPSRPELDSGPTEAVLKLIADCLPGWTIALGGTATEPDGHWHCALRESDAQDNDEVIGNGEGRTVSLALLRALISAAIARV